MPLIALFYTTKEIVFVLWHVILRYSYFVHHLQILVFHFSNCFLNQFHIMVFVCTMDCAFWTYYFMASKAVIWYFLLAMDFTKIRNFFAWGMWLSVPSLDLRVTCVFSLSWFSCFWLNMFWICGSSNYTLWENIQLRNRWSIKMRFFLAYLTDIDLMISNNFTFGLSPLIWTCSA